ncbi:MAG: hypothetical protein DDT21_02502 [Syntrophomonadaceae bacterium]|nr:hypothetical protein [Bacillota bacterium]
MPPILLDGLILGGRAVIIYAVILLMVKLMGKREVGQLSPFDFVVGVMIGSVAAIPMEDARLPFLPSLVPIIVLAGLEILVSTFALHNVKFRKLVEDKPTILVSDGKLLPENMRKVRMNIDDLKQELRKHGIVNINEVKEGTLESSGDFSVILKKEHIPLTASDLQTTTLHNLNRLFEVYAVQAHGELQHLLTDGGKAVRNGQPLRRQRF